MIINTFKSSDMSYAKKSQNEYMYKYTDHITHISIKIWIMK